MKGKKRLPGLREEIRLVWADRAFWLGVLMGSLLVLVIWRFAAA